MDLGFLGLGWLDLGLIYPFGLFHYHFGQIIIQIPFGSKNLFFNVNTVNINYGLFL